MLHTNPLPPSPFPDMGHFYYVSNLGLAKKMANAYHFYLTIFVIKIFLPPAPTPYLPPFSDKITEN